MKSPRNLLLLFEMSFLSKIFGSKATVDINGMTDLHCHILPGVDDGVKTLDEATAILAEMEKAGIKKVWFTPHIMEDIPNTPAKLRQRFEELKQAYSGSIELNLASENMIDSLLDERLAAGDVLPLGENENVLLVETSYFNPPMNFDRSIESIKSAGYFPLIAHPERYTYVGDMDEYKRWKDMGCLFQLNLLSLGGHYGPAAKNIATKLLKKGMYDYAGTDLHRAAHFESLQRIQLPTQIADDVKRLLSANDYV